MALHAALHTMGEKTIMNEQTLTKLYEMKLSGLAESYKEQSMNKDFQKMSFDDRLSLLIDFEHSRRQNNKLHRLINAAALLYSSASVEEIEYYEDRKTGQGTDPQIVQWQLYSEPP
jgi:IstB-like ATP binding N-terminal.